MLKMQSRLSDQDPKFSEPWHMSDAILLVEGERLHVHRSTLSMCSPFFERMFTADFLEKNQMEIQLPDKKASEIKEMLLMIYPNSLKKISESNVYFLLSLADEYLMGKLTERCTNYLLQRKKSKSESIDLLVLAQRFNLELLRDQCIKIAKDWPLSNLKALKKYKSVSPENRGKLAEERLEYVEVSCERYLNQFTEKHCCELWNTYQKIDKIKTFKCCICSCLKCKGKNEAIKELVEGIYNIVLH